MRETKALEMDVYRDTRVQLPLRRSSLVVNGRNTVMAGDASTLTRDDVLGIAMPNDGSTVKWVGKG